MADDDWLAVVWNMAKALTAWRRMTRILSREGERPLASVFFFIAVVQSVLLFIKETWMVTPCTEGVLGGFQDQVERRLTGQILWRLEDGKW